MCSMKGSDHGLTDTKGDVYHNSTDVAKYQGHLGRFAVVLFNRTSWSKCEHAQSSDRQQPFFVKLHPTEIRTDAQLH